MSPKSSTSSPHLPGQESVIDILALVEERTKGRDVDSPFLSRDIDHLLAVEVIRQLQAISFESSRIADSLIKQSSDMRNMLKQELDDFIFSNRDMVGTLSMILEKLPDPKEE